MAWHGCFHCAVRGVTYEGRLCDLCAEAWGAKSVETVNSRKGYHYRVGTRGPWRKFENAPEESPDWAGFQDRPGGPPVWPKYGMIYVGDKHPRKGRERDE